MKKLIERFSGLVKSTISGFDHIVFKCLILPLMSADKVMQFCKAQGILNKDYKSWMMSQTKNIIEHADQYAKDNCVHGVTHIPTWRTRKEALAHERQQQEHLTSGLIGVWSCLEAGSSYRAQYCSTTGYPQLRNYQTRCNHLYYYCDDPELGFMNIRLQTWFPYHIQVCLNGREWLRRSLEQAGIEFLAKGNKFLHIGDYEKAQQFLDQQLDVRFAERLNSFLPVVFQAMPDILGPHFSYYWTLWQSEWASDLIFNSPTELAPIMDSLLRYAHMTGTSTSVLRYLDRPLTKAGIPHKRSMDEVIARMTGFNDGIRLRHWVDKNSVKIYNEKNVLRVEATINDPGKFLVFRHKQGQDESEPKERLPIRKGVMDIPLRAVVSQDVNNRFANNLATLQDATPVGDFIKEITRPVVKSSCRFRALDPTGKDLDILQAISHPSCKISGFTNTMLRENLAGKSSKTQQTEKQLSAKISRHLRMLRAHGLIRKLPNQNRYQLTLKGTQLTNVVNAFLAASTENLLKRAA
jgi:predicted transcriptional regulator